MDAFSVYRDIQTRTNGQFLIGVVGPVRTGKSTFIRRFMEVLALPELPPEQQAEVRDALPLSGSGKLITTVEPKFIPKDALKMTLGEGEPVQLRFRAENASWKGSRPDGNGFFAEVSYASFEGDFYRVMAKTGDGEAFTFLSRENLEPGAKGFVQIGESHLYVYPGAPEK